MILLCFFLGTSISQLAPSSDTDTLPRTRTTPCPSPSTAGSAPPSSPTQLPPPSLLLSKATSRPPNPVVGSGWPGSGAGCLPLLPSPAGEFAKCSTSWGGTGSSLETRLARLLARPPRKRLIDPSIEPCCWVGFVVAGLIRHAADMYYRLTYKARKTRGHMPKTPAE